MSSTLCSLPCESLCLIASQLEGPDRQSLRQTCRTAAQATGLSTQVLVLPGSQLLSGCQSCQQACSTAICSCSDGWGCACCVACTVDADEQAQTPLQHFSKGSGPSDDSNSSFHIQEQSCSYLQRYSGVRSLTVTCCDACEGIATPTAGRFARVPGSPHTPTQTPSWISSCCSPSPSSCLRRVPQAPQVGSLSSFLAAAGSTMPHLQHLDLSTACPCLHSIPGGILEAIAGSCPRLATLSVPTWLLQPPEQQQVSALWILPRSSSSSFSLPLLRFPGAAWDPTLAAAQALAAASGSGSAPAEPYGLDRLWLRNQHQQLGSLSAPSSPQLRLPAQRRTSAQQHQDDCENVAIEGERLISLAALQQLTSLKLFGAAPPASALKRLAGLTQLQKFALEVTDTMPNVPVALSELPGWQGSALDIGSSGSNGGSSGGSVSSGAVLGASLAALRGLTSISLTGALHAGDTLKALAGLPKLVRVEIDSLPDFSVGSLANLSGLTRLTALRVQGCKALQATARSALPLQLHVLQELAVLELDFDLHLRDMQVLCLLKRLSHLTANSFHHCIHLMTGLTLPALRFLRVKNVSRFALQQQQQPGLPANLQLAQALAGPQLAAAAAAAMAAAAPGVGVPAVAPPPVPAAAAAGEGGAPDLPAAAAMAAIGAGAPVMPLSALPVLLNLQQQQQQQQQADEPPPFMLLAAPGGQALLVQHQQQHAGGAPVPMQLPAHPQHLGLPAMQQQQQPGMPGFNLQLLQLRQQQLHQQQQQIRLQQQQVRLQLQQMQAQFIQQAHQQPSIAGLAAAAAAGAGQAAPAGPQQAAVGPDMPAAAAAACAQPKGWLAVLFPGLEELHSTSAQDCAVAVPALLGHQTLRKLVIGTRQSGPPQQQLMGLLLSRAQAASSVMGAGSVGGGALYGVQGAGYSGGSGSRGVGAPWGVLRSLASLEELEIHDTAVVLGTTPWTLGAAVAGQLCRLVLRGAGSLTDLSAATLLGPYTWSKLTHLEIQGSEVLSDRGLNCFASLPALQHLHLSYCPGISACGLASFLLSSSSSMRKVDLLCCAGVQPAEAQAVQDAVWGITHRRVEVSWSRHDPVRH